MQPHAGTACSGAYRHHTMLALCVMNYPEIGERECAGKATGQDRNACRRRFPHGCAVPTLSRTASSVHMRCMCRCSCRSQDFAAVSSPAANKVFALYHMHRTCSHYFACGEPSVQKSNHSTDSAVPCHVLNCTTVRLYKIVV